MWPLLLLPKGGETLRDESTTKDTVRPNYYCCRLNDDTDYEDKAGDNDTVFARHVLGKRSRKQRPDPSTKLEDGRQPALLRLASCWAEGIICPHICESNPLSKTLQHIPPLGNTMGGAERRGVTGG